MKEKYERIVVINIQCKKCLKSLGAKYTPQAYKPRNINNLPKKPKTKCKLCNSDIYINRKWLMGRITLISKKGPKKYPGPKKSISQLEIRVLKELSKGLYPIKIYPILRIKKYQIYKIVKELKRKKLITQINIRPNIYELTNYAKFYIKYGPIDYKTYKDQIIKDREDKLRPKWIIEQRIHRFRFFQNFQNIGIEKNIPKELRDITQYGKKIKLKTMGLYAEMVKMNNWDRYIVHLGYSEFGGITKVEINLNMVIYNFKRTKEDSTITNKESFIKYLRDRIYDIRECRNFLVSKGFNIQDHDPIPLQKIKIAIKSRDELRTIGEYGKYLDLVFTDNYGNEIEVDNSPDDNGEEETDNLEDAISVYDIPKLLKDIDAKTKNTDKKIDAIEKAVISQANTTKKLSDTLEKMNNNFERMNDNFSKLLQMFNPPKPPGQEQPGKKEDNPNNEFYS